jgi:hypothetical protein
MLPKIPLQRCDANDQLLKNCAIITGMQTHRHLVHGLIAAFSLTTAVTALAAEVPAPPMAVVPAPAKAGSETVAPTGSVTAAAPSTQIWECTTNGVRTFSSNPCGTKSTLRELSPINVMEPAPAYHVTHTNTPSPPAATANYSYPAEDSSDANTADNAYNGYPGYIVVPRPHRVRANPAHNHPRPHHP